MLPYLEEEAFKFGFGAWLLVVLAVIWLFMLLISPNCWALFVFISLVVATVVLLLLRSVLMVDALILSSFELALTTLTKSLLDSFVSSSSFGAFISARLTFGVWGSCPSSLSESEPPGSTRRLHTGQKRLFLSSHLSIHSTWYASKRITQESRN